ncbi:MAG: thioesterase family protein [Muribaculaceae bacterium]|nr:thioesterase family protein [Muribaculaceae bacterium]
MLEVGIRGHKELVVTDEQTAKHMNSGAMRVYATPCMVALMEYAAFDSVRPMLGEGCGTVGTALNIRHVASTPVGMKVCCDSELIRIDGRALTFSVKVYDEKGLVGEGEHERFIIYEDKFQAKTDGKLERQDALR